MYPQSCSVRCTACLQTSYPRFLERCLFLSFHRGEWWWLLLAHGGREAPSFRIWGALLLRCLQASSAVAPGCNGSSRSSGCHDKLNKYWLGKRTPAALGGDGSEAVGTAGAHTYMSCAWPGGPVWVQTGDGAPRATCLTCERDCFSWMMFASVVLWVCPCHGEPVVTVRGCQHGCELSAFFCCAVPHRGPHVPQQHQKMEQQLLSLLLGNLDINLRTGVLPAAPHPVLPTFLVAWGLPVGWADPTMGPWTPLVLAGK